MYAKTLREIDARSQAYAAQAQADAIAGVVVAPVAVPSGGPLGLPLWAWITGAVALVVVVALLR